MKKLRRELFVNTIRNFGAALVCVLVLSIGFISLASEGVVKSSDVNVRQDASTTSAAVGSVTTNDKVTILEEKTGTDGKIWYKIKTSTGITGYVRSDFITKTEEGQGDDTTSTTQVTTVEKKTAYIAGNGNVNIRKEASTKSTLVASAKGQSEVTIIGEATATDGYKWYQIQFKASGTEMTGYIRSDLITFTAPVDNSQPAETTIEGTTGETDSEEIPETPSEEVVPEPVENDENGEDTNKIGKNITFLNPEGEPPVIPEGFEKSSITIGGENITGWGKGDFYILYAMKGESDAAWYLCDYRSGGFVSYDGLFDASASKASGGFDGKIVIIILSVLLVLAIVAIVLLILLPRRRRDDYDYDYDYDYDNEDDSSIEEKFVDYEQPKNPVGDEEIEEPRPRERKEKKSKASHAFRNFFTKEVDEEDDEEYFDDEADDDDYISDDDDDINFIDL